ncbi:hypothetical protein [Corynebacterium efficiens]|uniref:hypothetical protein n=1 Tax=Corynebacterium efficiens TaxID=152794 RepID=UPI0012DDE1F9|nr:hypothetical protein [Corynebacterium efficiens]
MDVPDLGFQHRGCKLTCVLTPLLVPGDPNRIVGCLRLEVQPPIQGYALAVDRQTTM